jgi:hypothetical protein
LITDPLLREAVNKSWEDYYFGKTENPEDYKEVYFRLCEEKRGKNPADYPITNGMTFREVKKRIADLPPAEAKLRNTLFNEGVITKYDTDFELLEEAVNIAKSGGLRYQLANYNHYDGGKPVPVMNPKHP